jgi:hypothetical protein
MSRQQVMVMNCPPDISVIVLEILQWGILRIRQLGSAGNPSRCAVEADHIHNLPHLLMNFSPDLLRFYWEVERPLFQEQSSQVDLTRFEDLWNELATHPLLSTSPLTNPR